MKLSRRAKLAIVVTMIVAVPVALYLIDRSASADRVARNVVVGTLPLGGLNTADATLALEAHRNELLRTTGEFSVNELEFKVSPDAIELQVDVRIGVSEGMKARRSGNPLTNFLSWVRSFTAREVIPLPVSFNDDAIDAELDAWEAIAIPDPAFVGAIAVSVG